MKKKTVKLKIKRMKQRKWPLAKKRRVLTERRRRLITVKRVCQKYDITATQYYRWSRRYPELCK